MVVSEFGGSTLTEPYGSDQTTPNRLHANAKKCIIKALQILAMVKLITLFRTALASNTWSFPYQ